MLNQYIETGDVDFITQCIKNRDAQLSQPDYNGNTPIHLASALGQEKVLALLLGADAQKCGVTVDARATYTQATPLHFAARNGRQGTMGMLLAGGADPNAKDAKGWTPLHYATIRNHPAAASQLIEKGADVNARTGNGDGHTPLHLACYCGLLDVAALLIRNGADISAKDDKDGRMPFDLLPIARPKREDEHKHTATTAATSTGNRRKSSTGSSSSSSSNNSSSSGTEDTADSEYANVLREAAKGSYKCFRENIYTEGIIPPYTDFTIKFTSSADTAIRCHKAIIAARSPLLRAELEKDPALAEHTVNENFGPVAFRMFLEWCYTGTVAQLAAPLTKADVHAVVQLISIASAYAAGEALQDICVAVVAENFSQELLPAIIDELLVYKSGKYIERLGAATIGAMLGLPEVDSLTYAYELFKKLPVETLEGIVLALNVAPREIRTAPRTDRSAAAAAISAISSSAAATDLAGQMQHQEPPPLQQQQQQQEQVEAEPLAEIFTLEFAQACPPEFKRKIKATNNKIKNFTFSIMLSEKNITVCRDMLATLRSIQNPGWFDSPVPDSQDYAPNYYNIVKHPMDLGTLEVN